MGQVYHWVNEKAEQYYKEGLKPFQTILQTKNVGLLVNERLVNMPLTIAPDLHEQLPEDLKFTMEQDDIKDPKEFKYDYLLVLTKFSVPNEVAKSNI